MPFGIVINRYLSSYFREKELNRKRKFFPALKCNLVDFIEISGIDVQIQTFIDKNLHSCFFEQ